LRDVGEEKREIITLRWKDGFADAVICRGETKFIVVKAGQPPYFTDQLRDSDLPANMSQYIGVKPFAQPLDLPVFLPRLESIPDKPDPMALFLEVEAAIISRFEPANRQDSVVLAVVPIAVLFQDSARLAVLMRFTGEFGGGKTRGADIVGQLMLRPYMASGSLKPATLFRLVDQYRCSLVINEGDSAISNANYADEIVCLLNSSFEPGHPIPRVDGEERKLRHFEVFGAKVITGRTTFRDAALESRIIDIQCAEAANIDKFPPALSESDMEELGKLRDKLYALRVWYGAKSSQRALPAGLPSGRVRQKVAALVGALPPELDAIAAQAIERIKAGEIEKFAQSEEGEAWAELYELGKDAPRITARALAERLGLSDRAAAYLLRRMGWKKGGRETIEGQKLNVWTCEKRIKDKAFRKLGLAGLDGLDDCLSDPLSEKYDIEPEQSKLSGNSSSQAVQAVQSEEKR